MPDNEEWRERLDRTQEIHETYRRSGFELTATIISLSAGSVAVFHEKISALEVAVIFAPVGVAVLHQFCRYWGLQLYAHTRIAADRIIAINGELDKGTDAEGGRIAEHRKKVLEYLDKGAESERWLTWADELCFVATVSFFTVGTGFILIKVLRRISTCV